MRASTSDSGLALFAIEVKDSELAGVRVETREHLFTMLEQYGFAGHSVEGPFTVLRRPIRRRVIDPLRKNALGS